MEKEKRKEMASESESEWDWDDFKVGEWKKQETAERQEKKSKERSMIEVLKVKVERMKEEKRGMNESVVERCKKKVVMMIKGRKWDERVCVWKSG